MPRTLVALALLLAAPAFGQTTTMRWATVAPDGTAWAREIHAFASEIEGASGGQLKTKWYLGGIAGSELEMGDRLARGQLDGIASGGILCERVMPSLRVVRMQALFQSRDEAMYVLSALQDLFAKEASAHGVELLGTTVLGSDVILLRAPVHSFGELKRIKVWRWDVDDEGIRASRAMGFQVVPMPLEKAGGAFERQEIDGLIGIPSAILAFQWFARAHYLIDLKMGLLAGCLVVAKRSFDRMTHEQQVALRSAGAKLRLRFNDVTRRQDDALLGGLFQKQGVTPLPVSAAMRAEYFDAARATRHIVGNEIAPETMNKVNQLLADYRAEHGAR